MSVNSEFAEYIKSIKDRLCIRGIMHFGEDNPMKRRGVDIVAITAAEVRNVDPQLQWGIAYYHKNEFVSGEFCGESLSVNVFSDNLEVEFAKITDSYSNVVNNLWMEHTPIILLKERRLDLIKLQQHHVLLLRHLTSMQSHLISHYHQPGQSIAELQFLPRMIARMEGCINETINYYRNVFS